MTRKPPGADSPGPEWRPPDGGTVEHTRPDPRAFTDTSSTSASHCVHWDNVSVDEYTAKNVCSMRHCSWIRGRTSTKETGPGRQACFSLGRVLKCCRHGRTDTLTIDHRQHRQHCFWWPGVSSPPYFGLITLKKEELIGKHSLDQPLTR